MSNNSLQLFYFRSGQSPCPGRTRGGFLLGDIFMGCAPAADPQYMLSSSAVIRTKLSPWRSMSGQRFLQFLVIILISVLCDGGAYAPSVAVMVLAANGVEEVSFQK